MNDTSSDSTLQTSQTTLNIISSLKELDGASLGELVEYHDLSKSTVHAHLQTLLDNQFIVKEGVEYRIGCKFFHYGEYARYQDPRYEAAKVKAENLPDTTSEEANFSIEEHGRVVTLFSEVIAASGREFQTGQYWYMHNTASGKAILSTYSKDRISDIIDRWGLPKQTEHTITKRDELMEELEVTRERGYSVNRQECSEGMNAVAVPVMNPNGSVFGSLDITGPSYRFPSEDELVSNLRTAASELEEEMHSYLYP